MTTLGQNVELSTAIKRFDGDEETFRRSEVLLEESRELPVEASGVFFEDRWVDHGANLELSVRLKSNERDGLNVFETDDEVPPLLFGKLGRIWNNVQYSPTSLPGGDFVESLIPDSGRRLSLASYIRVNNEHLLEYDLGVIPTLSMSGAEIPAPSDSSSDQTWDETVLSYTGDHKMR